MQLTLAFERCKEKVITKTVEVKMPGSSWSISGMVESQKTPFTCFKQNFSYNQRWTMLKIRPRTHCKSHRAKEKSACNFSKSPRQYSGSYKKGGGLEDLASKHENRYAWETWTPGPWATETWTLESSGLQKGLPLLAGGQKHPCLQIITECTNAQMPNKRFILWLIPLIRP